MAAHFTHHAGSGNCALCGRHATDLVAATHDGSIKRVLICDGCYTKMTGTPNDNALFTRVMSMLD
jgi:ribosome-binding protein aMBF1 (putative translation factor)